MPTTSMHRYRPRRKTWYRGRDGFLHTEKYHDDRLEYEFNFDNEMTEASETLSTVTTSGGPTVNSSSVSGDVLTLNISGSGVLDVTLTTSATRTIERTLVFDAIDRQLNDYR